MEYSDQIEDLLAEMEDDSERELSKSEKAILEVIEAASVIQSEGLNTLWHCSLVPENVIKSFDEVGAHEIVDLITSSQWCVSAPEDRGEYSDTEENHLAETEEELEFKLEDLPEVLEEYLTD